jgi:hypothetical protein
MAEHRAHRRRSTHYFNYFTNVTTLRLLASTVLAIVLWPLVLVGKDLHIH